jgi:outer membrane lipoprotein SlyB
MLSHPRFWLPLVLVATLSACAHRPSSVNSGGNYGNSVTEVQYGQVTRIETMSGGGGNTSGAGAVLGGIAGAVVGGQFGKGGHAKTTGGVVGAVTGALIGNEIEKQESLRTDGVRVTVALDRGGIRSIDVRDAGSLRVGDRVRVDGGRIERQ